MKRDYVHPGYCWKCRSAIDDGRLSSQLCRDTVIAVRRQMPDSLLDAVSVLQLGSGRTGWTRRKIEMVACIEQTVIRWAVRDAFP